MLKFSMLIAVLAGLMAMPGVVSAGDKREAKTRPKGVEMYSWELVNGDFMYVLQDGTDDPEAGKKAKNSEKAMQGTDAIAKALALLAEGESVHWGSHGHRGYGFPDKAEIEKIVKAAKQAKLNLTMDTAEVIEKNEKKWEKILTAPKEGKSTAEILKAIELLDRESIGKDKARVTSEEFSVGSQKVFVLSHSPFSGREACCVYLYVQDPKTQVWTRKLDTSFDNTTTITAKLDADKLVLRDKKRDIVYTYPSEEKKDKPNEKADGKKPDGPMPDAPKP